MTSSSPKRLRELAGDLKRPPRAMDADAMRGAADEIERLERQLDIRTAERDSWRAAYEASCRLDAERRAISSLLPQNQEKP